MLIVFAVGIERVEVYEGCVFVSILVHYFTLVAVMWMGAEALLMFQKLVIIFMTITTKFIVILSLVCWRKCYTLGPHNIGSIHCSSYLRSIRVYHFCF